MLFIIHLLKTTQFEVMSLISYCLSLYKMVACMKRKIFKQQAATHESPNRVMVGPFQKLNLLEKFDVWSKCPHLDFFPSPHKHTTLVLDSSLTAKPSAPRAFWQGSISSGGLSTTKLLPSTAACASNRGSWNGGCWLAADTLFIRDRKQFASSIKVACG